MTTIADQPWHKYVGTITHELLIKAENIQKTELKKLIRDTLEQLWPIKVRWTKTDDMSLQNLLNQARKDGVFVEEKISTKVYCKIK